MTKMGSIIGQKIDYNGVAAHTQQTYPANINPSTLPRVKKQRLIVLSAYLRHDEKKRI